MHSLSADDRGNARNSSQQRSYNSAASGSFFEGYIGLYKVFRVISGLYRDNGKENGNYYFGFPKIRSTIFGDTNTRDCNIWKLF